MTDSPTSSSATAQVLGVIELLQHILLQLDNEDLLPAQVASQAFHEAIEKSPRIQEKLCLSLASKQPAKWIDGINELLIPVLRYDSQYVSDEGGLELETKTGTWRFGNIEYASSYDEGTSKVYLRVSLVRIHDAEGRPDWRTTRKAVRGERHLSVFDMYMYSARTEGKLDSFLSIKLTGD